MLAQVAALDPSAPSWEFLQVRILSPCVPLRDRPPPCDAPAHPSQALVQLTAGHEAMPRQGLAERA